MKIDGGCHCGALTYEAEIDPESMTICHCTDCQKMSGSAFRTVVRADEDNFIMNVKSGDKIFLKPNGKGSYHMDVNFVGGERTTITVDSGAEENVCPWSWGEQFETKPAKRWMNFRNASGGYIDHYGKRDVHVVSPF